LKLPITETLKKSKFTITVAHKAKQNSTKKNWNDQLDENPETNW